MKKETGTEIENNYNYTKKALNEVPKQYVEDFVNNHFKNVTESDGLEELVFLFLFVLFSCSCTDDQLREFEAEPKQLKQIKDENLRQWAFELNERWKMLCKHIKEEV